jgi:hypothetical protein
MGRNQVNWKSHGCERSHRSLGGMIEIEVVPERQLDIAATRLKKLVRSVKA